jgi:hypothetical protein
MLTGTSHTRTVSARCRCPIQISDRRLRLGDLQRDGLGGAALLGLVVKVDLTSRYL